MPSRLQADETLAPQPETGDLNCSSLNWFLVASQLLVGVTQLLHPKMVPTTIGCTP